QLAEQVEDLRLVGGAVGRLAEDRVDLRLQLEDRLAGVPVGAVQRPGALKEVLDVERRDPHAYPRLLWSLARSTLLARRAGGYPDRRGDRKPRLRRSAASLTTTSVSFRRRHGGPRSRR